MRIDWRDVAERAAWTFAEGFILGLPATITMELDGAAWKTVLFSAALAGISAVKSFLVELIRNHNHGDGADDE